MKVLITGANGFLGRSVVQAFLLRGHSVRAMVKAVSADDQSAASSRLEFFGADLRKSTDLSQAFQGVDALVHLAAAVIAPDPTHYATTVGGTERLLNAMVKSKTRQLILASSMSVYDWSAIAGELTETSPTETRPYSRGAYAAAKVWQERIASRISEVHGWQLTILRPGVIWGRDHDLSAFVGPAAGGFHFVIGPRRHLPLTHVDNCAECFVAAAEREVSGVFNVVDSDEVSAWRYLGAWLKNTRPRRVRIPVPYWIVAASAAAVSPACRWLFGPDAKIPTLLMPERIAVLKPLRISNRKAISVLNWRPRLQFDEALIRS